MRIAGLANYTGLQIKIDNYDSHTIDTTGVGILHIGFIGDVSVKLFRGSKLLASKIYNSRLLPHPVVKLGPYSDTSVTFNQIKANNKVHIYFHNCLAAFKVHQKVFSFKLDMIAKDSTVIGSHSIIGSEIPNDILNLIKEMKSGEKIQFTATRTTIHHDRVPPFYIILK